MEISQTNKLILMLRNILIAEKQITIKNISLPRIISDYKCKISKIWRTLKDFICKYISWIRMKNFHS